MKQRLSYEFVKGMFEREGYVLLSKEYKNNYTKLDYVCPEGHKHSISWKKWLIGRRCAYCAGQGKPSINEIKQSFEKEGYVLLTNEYKNNKTKLDYICQKGHKHSIIWSAWKRGTRCPYCAGLSKPTLKFIRSEFEKEGYKLLSKEYITCRHKLKYECPAGHKHSITWSDWNSGHRCYYCFGSIKHTYEHIKVEFEKEGYTLLSNEYKNARTKLEYVCLLGHIHSITWSNWKKGHRCPTCASIKLLGPGNPSWKGGISYEPYCPIWKDKEYKSDIKERDGNTCLNPYCDSKNKNDLTIHHIDYNKKNCSPNNLITVCRSCNTKANKDRRWHIAWYQAVLINRGVL